MQLFEQKRLSGNHDSKFKLVFDCSSSYCYYRNILVCATKLQILNRVHALLIGCLNTNTQYTGTLDNQFFKIMSKMMKNGGSGSGSVDLSVEDIEREEMKAEILTEDMQITYSPQKEEQSRKDKITTLLRNESNVRQTSGYSDESEIFYENKWSIGYCCPRFCVNYVQNQFGCCQDCCTGCKLCNKYFPCCCTWQFFASLFLVIVLVSLLIWFFLEIGIIEATIIKTLWNEMGWH